MSIFLKNVKLKSFTSLGRAIKIKNIEIKARRMHISVYKKKKILFNVSATIPNKFYKIIYHRIKFRTRFFNIIFFVSIL